MRRLLLPILLIALWAPTLTPLHRVYGFGQRTMIVGIVEGLVLFGAAAAMLTATRRRRAPFFTLLVATVAGWLALTAFTNRFEPPRDRATAARHVSPAASSNAQPSAPGRVLLLCVDGLDWQALDELIAAGSLPFLTQLISNARTYQIDNHGLALSPGIWARAYTGNASEPIQGFVKWSPRNTQRDIALLPQWRHRPLFMLDRVLSAGAVFHLWDNIPASNADFAHPPLWRVAAAARTRVGVFDPLPFDVLGEQVHGFFAWQADDGFRIAVSNGGRPSIELVRDDTPSTSLESMIRSEAVRAGVASRLFARERPDVGIYYTHVLDAVGHMIWEPAVGRDVSAMRAERTKGLTAGGIGEAYRAVDTALEKLTAGFGGPATILVVSDHGWEFNVYAHRTAPLGTAIVAGAATKGYGGVIPVESVAATVLALAQVPISPTMMEPVREIAPRWTTCSNCANTPGTFLPAQGGDLERQNRLRSLGYITK